jgi:hypothetical protein
MCVCVCLLSTQGNGTFQLLVEGTNIQGVMTTPGVVGHKVTSNHILGVEQVSVQCAQSSPV